MEKIIAVFLCVCLFLTPVTVEAKKKATSGVDENGNKWTYDTTTKTLTFSGTKDIEDFSMNGHDPEPAWYEWSEKTEHIVIEDGITGIGESAFSDFTNASTVSMGDSVKRINRYAFSWCKKLKKIELSPNITIIQEDVFSGCDTMISLELPAGLKKLGSLGGCESLTSISIPDGVTELKTNAFAECFALTSIELSQNMKKIGAYSFFGCKKLKKVSGGANVSDVSMSAFQGSGLKKIVLSDNVVYIKSGVGKKRTVFGKDKGLNYPTKNLRVIEIHSKKVKSIQKNSFSGLSSKVVIKVPKSKKKKYTKMLRKSGLSKKVKIKAL